MVPGLDLAAELVRHGLFAVANAKHRDAGLEDRHWRQRRILVEYASRTTGKDHAFRLHLPESAFGFLERYDFAIHAFFAHAPRNELCDLRAKIDDQNFIVRNRIPRFRGGF